MTVHASSSCGESSVPMFDFLVGKIPIIAGKSPLE